MAPAPVSEGRTALRLRDVPWHSGSRWLRDAFRLFRRRPLGLMSMLVSFIAVVSLVLLLPWPLAAPLLLMSPPLLSLGFMVAAQSALLDGPVNPGLFIQPLRADPLRRRRLLLLCGVYGLSWAVVLTVCWGIGGEDIERLFDVLAGREPGADNPERMAELSALPGVRNAVTTFNLLGALMSVPFWHAPALVHWGAQGVLQSLFSSTVALWRAKGAFLVYALLWSGVSAVVAITVTLLVSIFGPDALGLLLAMAVMLGAWAVFYVSVLFTFNDSFGGAGGLGVEAPAAG